MQTLNAITNHCNLFLLDASGVIYRDFLAFPGVPNTIQKLQKIGPVYIVTNNAFQNPVSISETLTSMDIHISPTHIISSGHGLKYDTDIHTILTNKKVFIFGSTLSHYYIEQTQCEKIVNNIEDAECIVLTSSFKDHTPSLLNPIKNFLKNNPDIPVICANPDKVVMTQQGLKPVIGFFAEKLSEELKKTFYWIGKPYQNFSKVVKAILTDQGHNIDMKCCFFDDNYHNVQALKSHLGISGCLIKNTGISKNLNITLNTNEIDFILPSLSE